MKGDETRVDAVAGAVFDAEVGESGKKSVRCNNSAGENGPDAGFAAESGSISGEIAGFEGEKVSANAILGAEGAEGGNFGEGEGRRRATSPEGFEAGAEESA